MKEKGFIDISYGTCALTWNASCFCDILEKNPEKNDSFISGD